jgi:hypothetical protein
LCCSEYDPGQGIAAHIDAPIFGEEIASISLGGPVVMDLTKDSNSKGSAPERNFWAELFKKWNLMIFLRFDVISRCFALCQINFDFDKRCAEKLETLVRNILI